MKARDVLAVLNAHLLDDRSQRCTCGRWVWQHTGKEARPGELHRRHVAKMIARSRKAER